MAIVDRQGRLFGKVSILDIGAALIILFIIIGIFVPGNLGLGTSAQVATGGGKTVEVDVVVRGLNVLKPDTLLQQFASGNKISFVVRNQPAGELTIKTVKPLERTVIIPQPNGTPKAFVDPRPDSYSMDMIVTVTGKGQDTPQGLVIGNTKVKIGSTVEIDARNYNFNASVIDIRIDQN
jgi:hypothetical protein